MQCMNECELKAREYYHFRALKYAICDGSNAAHIQECFQSLKDYRAHIAHAKSMGLRKLFECLPQEVKRQGYNCHITCVEFDRQIDGEIFDRVAFGVGFGRDFDMFTPITLEAFHIGMQRLPRVTSEFHFTTNEPMEYVAILFSSINKHHSLIPNTLLPFLFPAFVPLMEVVSFPEDYQTIDRYSSFQASEFCSRAHAVNAFDLSFYSNKLYQCTYEWIERKLTHPVRILRLSFYKKELYDKDIDRIIEHCVHITKPRFLRIKLSLYRYKNDTVNIIPLLHVLMRIITNWPCDVQLIVESCFDLDSVWIASCINLSPHYPFRITLKHIHPTLLHSEQHYTRKLVVVNMANECLKREIKLHSLRLHCASKFFTFGQLPYDGPMETTAQCFSACAYYNRHFPEMSAYLGGEFPQRPISLQS